MKYIRVELPGGHVRVLREPTFTNLRLALEEFAKCMSNSEYVDAPKGELEANLKGGPFWKHVLTTL